MTRGFESSSAADLPRDAVLECGVCWWRFDPAVGDPDADIPPGLAFVDLPADFRCPCCDNPKSKFMVPEGGAGAATARQAVDTSLDARVGALQAAYGAAQAAMRGLPVHNDALVIEPVGFREHGPCYAGVIVTPWCMNVCVLPVDPTKAAGGAIGSKRSHVFPSGAYEFVLGRMDGVGVVETCSLFSPMDEFDDPAVARATAEAAAEGLFSAPEPEPAPKVTRRFLMTRNGATA